MTGQTEERIGMVLMTLSFLIITATIMAGLFMLGVSIKNGHLESPPFSLFYGAFVSMVLTGLGGGLAFHGQIRKRKQKALTLGHHWEL